MSVHSNLLSTGIRIIIILLSLTLYSCKNRGIADPVGGPLAKGRAEIIRENKAKEKRLRDNRKYEPFGIDVSHHQGFIDWARVKADKPKLLFAYVKLTEGADYVDPRASVNATEAACHDIPVGGYHYFRMTSSARAQFKNFKEMFDRYVLRAKYRLIPMVDVETADGCTARQVRDSLHVMLDLLEKEYGRKPMIYATMRSYNTLLAPEFNDYPLYIGRLGDNEPEIKDGRYTIWQYSERGHIDGIPKSVDLARFNATGRIPEVACPMTNYNRITSTINDRMEWLILR